jgi:hypothetical protein
MPDTKPPYEDREKTVDDDTKRALDDIWITECLILMWLTVLTVSVVVLW